MCYCERDVCICDVMMQVKNMLSARGKEALGFDPEGALGANLKDFSCDLSESSGEWWAQRRCTKGELR